MVPSDVDDITVHDLRPTHLVSFDRVAYRWRPVPYQLDLLAVTIVNTLASRMPGEAFVVAKGRRVR